MSDKCKDFINKCLSKDPKERIGYKNDVEEVIGHPWFADIDVNALINKQIEVEFKPKLSKNVLDVSNFEKMFTSEEAVHSVLPVNVTRKIGTGRLNAHAGGVNSSTVLARSGIIISVVSSAGPPS